MDLRPNQDRCRYFEGLFSPYIAGGLNDEERRALAEHLHTCERCSQQFGLSWRRATARIGATTTSKARSKSSTSSKGLWILAIASLLGVSLLGAMGLLDASEGRSLDPLGRGAKRQMDEELARMIHVQTTLLESVVEPMRGTRQAVTHAARGHARDFVEQFSRIAPQAVRPPDESAGGERAEQRALATKKLEALEQVFHPLLRVRDPQAGGRTWNRGEWSEALLRDGIPPVVLVEVVAAYREVLFVRLTWGDRPAFAWLLRDESERAGASKGEGSSEPAEQGAGQAAKGAGAVFQLAFLVLAEV